MIRNILTFALIYASIISNAQMPELNGSPSKRMVSEVESPVFRKNNGQWDKQILYRMMSGHTSIAFYKDKIQFGLRKVTDKKSKSKNHPEIAYAVWDLKIDNQFSGSAILAEGKSSSKINYFKGESGKSIEIEESSKLTYSNVYPNIDLVFYLDKRKTLKYDFVVKAGGNISDIHLTYEGIKKLKKDSKGNLIITAPWGNKLKEGKPISWQTIAGKKVPVDIEYQVSGNTLTYKSNSALQSNATLTIDPMMLDWSTYFYGKIGNTTWGYTYVMDMDIDKSNNVYVTGFTTEKFPMKTGTYDTIPNSTFYDGFVAKMSVNGDSLIYFTYVGGSSFSYILSIAVNSQREPVISGFTYSQDYPVTSNAYDKTKGSSSGYRGFITKFSSDFKSLVFSTFFGNSNSWGTVIQAMSLTTSGDVIFTGNTNANDLPVTTGCYQSKYGGGTNDAFLSRLSADGSKLLYSTYFGGTGDDKATDLSVNATEDVYIVGSTSNSNFPLTIGAQGPFKYTNSDASDGFVARIQSDGKKLIWSKMMGGTGNDYFEGLYVNANDELYIAGYSNSSNFYTTNGVVQKTSMGGYDHVIVKMNKSGTNLFYSTYLGGSGDDYFYTNNWWTSNIRITANVKDEAIIGGVTKSYNYPITTDALQPQNNSKGTWGWSTNVAITKLSYDGSKLLYGTYFGGSEFEWPTTLKVKKISCMSSILYGGITASKDYPTSKGVFKEKSKNISTGYSYSGFMSRFRDTLYTEPIDFKADFIECDNVFEILDAKNRGADYLWSDNSKRQNLIIEDTGVYWVRATYGCDTVSDTIHIKLEYSPKLDLPADTILCNNVSGLNLDAQNDTILRKYLWNTTDTTQIITAKNPGQYHVTVSTPNCGEISDTINVKFLKIPDLYNIKDSLFCDQVNWLVKTDSLGPDTKYKWSTGDTLLTTNIKTVGTYNLKVSNYCGSDSINFSSDVIYTPVVDMPKDTVVCNQFTLKFKVGRPKNQEMYTWYDPIQKSVFFNTDDSMILSSSAYLAIRIRNRCGSAKDSTLVQQRYSPTINLGNDSIYCNSINKIYTIGKPNNAETYLWKGGFNTNSFTVSSPGKYWASIKNICGEVSDTILFTQKNSLKIDLGSDSQFCNAVNKKIDILQPDADAKYLWSSGSTATDFTATAPGKVFASITNLCGVVSDTVYYTLITKPQVDLGNDYIYCDVVKPVNKVVGKANNDEIYLWSDAKTGNTNDFNSAGKFWVDLSNKCGTASDTFSISLIFSPQVDIGLDTALCGNFALSLDAGNPGYTYLWEPTGETTQTIFATQQTTYKVTVTDINGCFGEDEMEVKDDCKSKWFIPNSFSPNGDNVNDKFTPYFLNCEGYSISIFNTWGELVYQSSNLSESWDGKYLDKDVQTGHYGYTIHFKSGETKRWHLINGVITIVK